jgi:hypothetical protein
LKFEVNQERRFKLESLKKKGKEVGRWHGSEDMEIKQTYRKERGGRKEEI